MTAEERAYDLCNRIEAPGWGDEATIAIAVTIREAVAAEREACAQIAENHGKAEDECGGGENCWHNIAREIRARKD